ncbi:chemotaxis protein CheX [Geomonas sp. Red32]|uniref:chemotaxis protein CheX n=1 Tax=Geomonas sp. Red32 TaxID=2912856 RepID=UPI00202CE91E|nr:chemotaxis protein CheX [Geomonas sp. Red32]MCM0082562.1 chemotaxis protein CheX [Geomonas sp. Red32]
MVDAKILELLNTTEEKLVENLHKDVAEIFTTMIGVEITSSEVAETATQFKESVSAMVGFAGGYNGMISLNTPRSLALHFASQMLGMGEDECEGEMDDAMGEIANMIGGSFKHQFVKDGHEVRLSTPSVIRGDEYHMTVGTLPGGLTLRFETGAGHFTVSVYLENGD